ncbi:MAG TPA: YceI family protein [Candidatus Binataceae bacterium]|nr:YceI family protein [Candidatus Binataceae bacterium]
MSARRTGNLAIRGVRIAALIIATAFCAHPAKAAEQHFRIDLDATEVSVAVPEPLSWIRGDAVGKFRMISCDVYQDPKRPANDGANIWVEAVIDASSYRSGSSMRDSDVKSAILDAKDFPTISFKGGSSWTDVKQTSDSAGSAVLKGQLMLHGETRPFEVPVQVALAGDKLIANGEISFDYTDFGIKPPSMLGLKAGNIAKVSFHAVAIKAPQGL